MELARPGRQTTCPRSAHSVTTACPNIRKLSGNGLIASAVSNQQARIAPRVSNVHNRDTGSPYPRNLN